VSKKTKEQMKDCSMCKSVEHKGGAMYCKLRKKHNNYYEFTAKVVEVLECPWFKRK
jgi:hypothetical protein